MTLKKIMVFAAAAFAAVAFAQTAPVVKMSDLQKIDMESLLDVPVGSTLLGTGIKHTSLEEDVMQIGVPLEWSERAKCRALRVSHLLVDNRRLIILGGLGSNVSRSPACSSRIPQFLFLTRRRAPSIRSPRPPFKMRSAASRVDAPRLSSRTDSQPSATRR